MSAIFVVILVVFNVVLIGNAFLISNVSIYLFYLKLTIMRVYRVVPLNKKLSNGVHDNEWIDVPIESAIPSDLEAPDEKHHLGHFEIPEVGHH